MMTKRVRKLKDRLLNDTRDKLDGGGGGGVVNGITESRYEGNLNLSFAYVEEESFLMGLKT
ncbi:putative sulfurtransferase [Helianthus annuus]|nr:putative sulfurtransferase [Helianthus annuus]